MVIVSDEEDNDPLSGNKYVSHYMEKLKEIKSDDDFSISVIVQTNKCVRKGYSVKYANLARKASGEVYSVCKKDFSAIAKDLAHSIKDRATSFRLSKVSDLATLQVFVDGELKTKDKDWRYEEETNRIFFLPGSFPETGDEIEIKYRHSEF